MPFKDNEALADREYGWSPDRCMRMGEDCLGALHAMLDELKAAKKR